MKRLFGGLALFGAAAGVAILLRSRLSGETSEVGEVRLTFDDGSSRTLSAKDIEGREFADIAGKLVEMGL